MAASGIPTPGGAPSTRTRAPRLLALVVIAVAYQQSPYVPIELEPGLHLAVPILASMLLTQLAVRATRETVARIRALIDLLKEGELVLRLQRRAER